MGLVYKYYSNESKYAFCNVIRGVITFTPLESLNDLFEGTANYVGNCDSKEYYDNLATKEVNNTICERFKEQLNTFYRVFCASDMYDETQLWTFYANNNKGFCVGYEKDDIKNNNSSITIKKIEYKKSPKDLSSFNPDAGIEEIANTVLFTKNEEWYFESEVRAVLRIRKNALNRCPINMNCFRNDVISIDDWKNNVKMCHDRFISLNCPPRVIYAGVSICQADYSILKRVAEKYGIELKRMKQDLLNQKLVEG